MTSDRKTITLCDYQDKDCDRYELPHSTTLVNGHVVRRVCRVPVRIRLFIMHVRLGFALYLIHVCTLIERKLFIYLLVPRW